MKYLLPLFVATFLSMGSAYAANVDLINGSPQEGAMNVQYLLLNGENTIGKPRTTTVPKKIALPENATGIRVVSLTSLALPMLNHQFVFPKPGCEWKTLSGKPAEITFSVSAHQVSCH